MFIKFKGCGHSEFFPPARSAHTRTMGGICFKCKRRLLVTSLVTVEVRRRLIVDVETAEEQKKIVHRLSNDELRPTRKRG